MGRGSRREPHHPGYGDCRDEALMLYLIVKYIHILAAIVAVGLNISYAIWILRAQREPAHTGFALKGIKFLDDRIANPAYGGLLRADAVDRRCAGPVRPPGRDRGRLLHTNAARTGQARRVW